MSKPSKYLIYGLFDPRDGALRYVGKSSVGLKRANAHWSESRLVYNQHKTNWIRLLKKLNLKYEIVILEEFDSDVKLNEAEIEWIAQARFLGCDLTNKDDGGGGRSSGHKASLETRAKMSESHKNRKRSKEELERNARRFVEINKARAGKPLTPETKAKISLANIGKTHTEEAKRKIATASSNFRHTPETKAKLSEIKLGTKWQIERVLKFSRSKGGRPFVDQFGEVYQTQRSASRMLNISQADICKVLQGKYKQVKGFIFKYLESV
jgi:hypothetical protein